jgi:membrane-bound metal-dependent hydrolase YbcI (DUF457 family)
MGPTHALFGVTSYVALPLLGVPAPLIGVGWAAGSALLPDIDHHDSTVTHFLGPIARGFRWVTGARHRGLTHQWWFLGLVLIAVAAWRPLLLLPVGIGWGSHLVGDHIPRTGGFLENRIVRPLLWVALAGALLAGHVFGLRVI